MEWIAGETYEDLFLTGRKTRVGRILTTGTYKGMQFAACLIPRINTQYFNSIDEAKAWVEAMYSLNN